MNPIHILQYLWSKVSNRNPQLANIISRAEDHKGSDANPWVTIIIPTRDRADLLQKCLDSIQKQTSYRNFEILIVDNGSKEQATFDLLKAIEKLGYRVIRQPGEFNFSRIINSAVNQTPHNFICVLNNDIEVLSQNWLLKLVQHAARPDVAVAGALLTYPDGTIQHAGIALGYSGVATHAFARQKPTDLSHSMMNNCFEVAAVTFACAVIRKETFDQLGGLDENLKVGLNDVDFCVRATAKGLKNVICADSRLIHLESQSRPRVLSFRGFGRALAEVSAFMQKHDGLLEDPYFRRKISR